MSEREQQYGSGGSLNAVYEQYKHLDCLLSDQLWLGGSQKSQILYDLWRAIKYAVVNDTSDTPSPRLRGREEGRD